MPGREDDGLWQRFVYLIVISEESSAAQFSPRIKPGAETAFSRRCWDLNQTLRPSNSRPLSLASRRQPPPAARQISPAGVTGAELVAVGLRIEKAGRWRISGRRQI